MHEITTDKINRMKVALVTGSSSGIDHPNTKSVLLYETEKGNELILEITPSYYFTWNYSELYRLH
jgi:hypothetical protein